MTSGGGASRPNAPASAGDGTQITSGWPPLFTSRSHSASSRDRMTPPQQYYQQQSHHSHLQHPQPQHVSHLSQLEHNQRESNHHSSTPRIDPARSTSQSFVASATSNLESSLTAQSTWSQLSTAETSPWTASPAAYMQSSSDLVQQRGLSYGTSASSAYSVRPSTYSSSHYHYLPQQGHPYAQQAQQSSYSALQAPPFSASSASHYVGRTEATESPTLHHYARTSRPSGASGSSMSSYSSMDAYIPAGVTSNEPYLSYAMSAPPITDASHASYMLHPGQPSVTAAAPHSTYTALEGYTSIMPSHYPGYSTTDRITGTGSASSGPSDSYRDPRFAPITIKHRRRTTKTQFEALESTFQQVSKPSPAVRKSLSIQLDMQPRAIQIWFQNRRAKAKLTAKAENVADATSDQAEDSMTDTYEAKGKERIFSDHGGELRRRHTTASSRSEPGPYSSRISYSDDRSPDASSSDQSHALRSPGHAREASADDRYASIHSKYGYSSYGSSASSVGGDRLAYRMTPTSSFSSFGSMPMHTNPSSASASSSTANRLRADSQSSSGYAYSNYSHTHSLSSLAANATESSPSPRAPTRGVHRRSQSISNHASSATLSARKMNQASTLDPISATSSLSITDSGRRLSWSPSPSAIAELPLPAGPPASNLLDRDSSGQDTASTTSTPWSYPKQS